MVCSPPGSSLHGIFQARILEWVAISFSRGSSPPWDQFMSLASLTLTDVPLSHLGNPCTAIFLSKQAPTCVKLPIDTPQSINTQIPAYLFPALKLGIWAGVHIQSGEEMSWLWEHRPESPVTLGMKECVSPGRLSVHIWFSLLCFCDFYDTGNPLWNNPVCFLVST